MHVRYDLLLYYQFLYRQILSGEMPDGCDAFINEECEYYGKETGFSTEPGHIVDAVSCQEHCKIFQVNTK